METWILSCLTCNFIVVNTFNRDWESLFHLLVFHYIWLCLCLSRRVNQCTLSSPSPSLLQPCVSFSHRLSFFVLWAPFDVGVQPTHTSIFTQWERREEGRKGGGGGIRDGVQEGGAFGMSVCVCVLLGGRAGKGVNEDEDSHSPLSLSPSPPPSLSLPGGLYGWKWGVLSATSLAQTVPSALSEDQPERGAADNHRHRGSVPHRKAAHSPGIPHGELHPALQFCVYPRCGGSLHAPAAPPCCSVAVVVLCLCVALLLQNLLCSLALDWSWKCVPCCTNFVFCLLLGALVEPRLWVVVFWCLGSWGKAPWAQQSVLQACFPYFCTKLSSL